VEPLSAHGLRAFPPETRLQIFEKTMHWDGKAPPLRQALRSEVRQRIPELYYEALKRAVQPECVLFVPEERLVCS
jgi:hypothetical protein